MNNNSPNTELDEIKQPKAKPDKTKTQEKESDTHQEQRQFGPPSTEAVEGGQAEPAKAVASQSAELTPGIIRRFWHKVRGLWHTPAESKNVAIRSVFNLVYGITAVDSPSFQVVFCDRSEGLTESLEQSAIVSRLGLPQVRFDL